LYSMPYKTLDKMYYMHDTLMKGYSRKIQDRIRGFLDEPDILAILGPQQVGKNCSVKKLVFPNSNLKINLDINYYVCHIYGA